MLPSESASFYNLPPKKNFPWEYFLAADKGNVYIVKEGKGHENLIAFISLLLIQK